MRCAGQLAPAGAPAGRPEEASRLVIEREQTRTVSAAQRDVGGEKCCAQRMVDARDAVALAAHAAPGVDREDDVLVRLGLVLAHDEVVAARGGAPVDMPDLVADAVGA